MKSIAVVLAVLVALAFVAKDFSWRIKGVMFAALVAMIILLLR
jgi:membrane protein implicated in regulation of membrane protease activity